MGIGLRLSNAASIDLESTEKLDQFKSWLAGNDAYVFTMNGFPFGDFHNVAVKDQVHAPDWTTKERLDYTLRLFDILAKLLPEGMTGGISTSPLTYRFWYSSDDLLLKAREKATSNVCSVIEHLYLLKKQQGIEMHLDIEPEPDGLLETGEEFIEWYQNFLIPTAKRELVYRLNISEEEVIAAVRQHICLCYDICHFAIGYESHPKILNELLMNSISVGKIQISAALKADLLSDQDERHCLFNAFSRYNEPTYLHQVVARTNDQHLIRYRDLPEALTDIQNPDVDEWRAHFHVPIFQENMGLLKSTQSDILEVLNIHKTHPFTTHLEVETYTWEVLPDTLKAPIDQSIIRELKWVKEVLDE
jgi:hypothetical protein